MKEHFLSDKLRYAFFEFLNKKFKNNEIDFKQFVDAYKSIKNSINHPCFYELLENEGLFEELIQNNKLIQEDVRYLLNILNISNDYELICVYYNTPLIKHILNEFVLDKELVDKFNIIIENSEWFKENNLHTLFDSIEDHYKKKNNEKILELTELNKKVYLLNILNLNKDQQDELIEVLRSNEIAQNRLNQIIDNHVESNYDFNSLMKYLKKPEKKTLLNI